MEEHTLLSPEKVYLDLDLAGVGSRFAANFIDCIFITLLLGFIVMALSLTGLITSITGNTDSALGMLLLAFFVLAANLILLGYFIFFETFFNGQTPGKMFLKIRVVQDNSSPVTFIKVLIRNVLRLIDTLPTFYAIGIIVILASKKNQRLGDLAAGTIVVRENITGIPEAVEYEVAEYPWTGAVRLHIREIEESEFAVLKKFLLRRPTLHSDEVSRLEQKLVIFFCRKLGLDPQEIDRPASFLEQVAALYQHR